MSAHQTRVSHTYGSQGQFGYPEAVAYRAGFVAVKSRALPGGAFEAVSAFFFGGVRLAQHRVEGSSRYWVRREARRLASTGGR